MLVWQDFAIACGRYPQSDDFSEKLRDEAEQIVKKLRQHPSLVLWCGSNENDESFSRFGLDADQDRLTRKTLREAVFKHDPSRPYVVGSPALNADFLGPRAYLAPEQHLWGERAWFKDPFYRDNMAVFVGETGFHGCPPISSIRKFISGDPASLDFDSEPWKIHETAIPRSSARRGYSRTHLMHRQAELCFGNAELQLDAFVPKSQIYQAEALKFLVEHSRQNPDRRGIIWWNLIDCWPQTSDAVIDYYFQPKLAYYYLRRIQQPTLLMLRESNGWEREVVLVHDGVPLSKIEWTVREVGSSATLAGGLSPGPVDSVAMVAKIPIRSTNTCYLLEWHNDECSGANHYLAGSPPFSISSYLDEFLPEISALSLTFSRTELGW